MQIFFRHNLFFAFLVMTCLMSVALFSSVHAQSDQELAEESARQYEDEQSDQFFQEQDIKALTYGSDKAGCALKSSMFVSILNQYKLGAAVADVAGSKITEPLVQEVYDAVREKGIERASLDNIAAYQGCVEKAPLNDDPAQEAKQKQIAAACSSVNGMILDTLSAIKRGVKFDIMMNKYAKSMDLSGTGYENIDDPAVLFIGALYKKAQTDPYEDVVQLGGTLAVGCSY